MGHHMSHCSGSFYQSGFDSAIVFSLDGGGLDYVTDIDLYIESTKVCKYQDSGVEILCNGKKFNPGVYGCIGYYVSEILKSGKDSVVSNSDKFALSFAGKLMGLCAYGEVKEEWVEPLINFYKNHAEDHYKDQLFYELEQYLGIDPDNRKDYFSGKDSYDLAATNQYVFEKLSFEYIKPFIEKYNLNVVFSGGCALNVLFNQKLKEYLSSRNLNLYVSPHPNDCGLSLGHYLHYTGEKINISPYCGIDILDRHLIPQYYNQYKNKVDYSSPQKIVDLISHGKIGGIIRGYSEIGPRALGNRTIICDPSFPDMKDVLNSKVKFREWFRPFAPVCRVEDKDEYFSNAFKSPFMTYAPGVNPKYRDKIKSIVHEDGTARIQTVTEEQHKLFYDILTCMEKSGRIPIVLNTSFNIKGNPILTDVKDAFHVLENTELDFLVVENLLFVK
jgi:carbamoyltransferase